MDNSKISRRGLASTAAGLGVAAAGLGASTRGQAAVTALPTDPVEQLHAMVKMMGTRAEERDLENQRQDFCDHAR